MVRLIVGLGNPGPQYQDTRHNMGYLVLDKLAQKESLTWKSWKSLASICQWKQQILLKPLTFMNDSGRAVKEFCAYHSAYLPQEILALSDEMALPLGLLRLRRSGSSGGHKGLESLIQHLSTEEFPRLRLGIGPPPGIQQGKDYVLDKFSSQEQPVLEQTLDTALDVLQFLSQGTPENWDTIFESAMNKFNKKADQTTGGGVG